MGEKRANKSRENESQREKVRESERKGERKKKQERKKQRPNEPKRENEIETQSKHTVHGVSISISYPVCGSKCVHICQWNQFVKLIFYSIPLDRIKCDKEVELNSIEKNLHTYNSFLYPLKLGARVR